MKLLLLFLILCAVCVLYLISIKPRICGRPDYKPFYGHMYAHRGLHGTKDGDALPPENSYSAIKLAADKGYGIEFDVHLTKDGILVVFHDDTLSRVCGVNGYLKDYTFEELKLFCLMGTQEHIPSFEEALAAVDGRVPLIIEYKVDHNAGRLCSICDRILSNYKGAYCIESFHPLAVHWYKVHRPDIVRGQLSEDFTRRKLRPSYFLLSHLIGNFYASPDFVAYNCKHKNELSRTLCRKLYHALSVAWTVRSQEELEHVSKRFDLFIFEGFVPSVQ
ncbi:MAG: glycerophosphodiester phosphodiesterase [Lachnospiraceae bacterium]|nr:glycerophosphodiester phosphodiesterase [Lachnospiraceae bacterium]